MGSLSHLIDPRFLHPLASALSSGPHTELELRAKFIRAVPNRNLSLRSLHIFLDLAKQGGLITFEQGAWRTLVRQNIKGAVTSCMAKWCDPQLTDDALFRQRCAVSLDRGMLSPAAEYTPLEDLARRSSLTDTEWARVISGPSDLCQLTGWTSKHTEADFLILYRSARTAPITDDFDVVPRVPRSLLPALPATSADFLSSIRAARSAWWEQVDLFLAGVTIQDLSGFAAYAKELLDLLLWGAPAPLRSLILPEHVELVSQMLLRFGLRAEDLSTVWRALPSTYRQISRLSWGVRYLNNNLSHPQSPEPDASAFLKVCSMPLPKQSAISMSRSGHSLLTLVRPLRVLHRALEGWRGRAAIATAALDCANAIASDMHEDSLLRREFALRVQRLNVIGSVHILDALAHKVSPPVFQKRDDEVLTSAGLIAAFSEFLDSVHGHAYAEVRLALHAALDFQRRYNIHALVPPQRYDGVWRGTIEELVTRLEDTRKGCIPV